MTEPYVQRELDAAAQEEAQARAILDTAMSETRTTTAEEDERFDTLLASVAAHRTRAHALASTDAENARLAAAVRGVIGDITTGDTRMHDPIREQLMSGERQFDYRFPETDAIRAIPWDDRASETRAISNFDDGSSLFASDFAGRVAMYARTMSPWIGLGTVVTSSNGRPLIVPTLTGDVTVYTPGEGTAITPSDPTLGTVTVSPTGFKALTYVSRESVEDEDVNLTAVLARSHARAIALAFGSTATTAVLAGISNGGTATGIGGYGTAVGAFLGLEDLWAVELGRAAPYRSAGNWVMANAGLLKVRKFRDADGNYISPTPLAGQLYEDPYLAAPASATKSVCFGDWGAALMIKATPIRVEVSKDFLFDTDQVAIKTVQRIALAVQDPAAAAYLVSADA